MCLSLLILFVFQFCILAKLVWMVCLLMVNKVIYLLYFTPGFYNQELKTMHRRHYLILWTLDLPLLLLQYYPYRGENSRRSPFSLCVYHFYQEIVIKFKFFGFILNDLWCLFYWDILHYNVFYDKCFLNLHPFLNYPL